MFSELMLMCIPALLVFPGSLVTPSWLKQESPR